jgi:hypothetical protein
VDPTGLDCELVGAGGSEVPCGGDYCPPELEFWCYDPFGGFGGDVGGGGSPGGGAPLPSQPPNTGQLPMGNSFLGFNLFCSGHNIYTGPIPNPTPQPSVWSCALYFLNSNLGNLGAFATND